MPSTKFPQYVKDGDTVQSLTVNTLTSTDMEVDNMNTNNIDRLGTASLTLTNNVTTNPVFKGTLLAEKCLRIGDVAATGGKIAHNGAKDSNTNVGEQIYAADITNNVEDLKTATICMMGSNGPSSIFMGRQADFIGSSSNPEDTETVGELLFAGNETNTDLPSISTRLIAHMKVKADNIQSSLYRNVSRFEFGVETLGNANAMDTPALTIQREGNGNNDDDVPGSANIIIDGNVSLGLKEITDATNSAMTETSSDMTVYAHYVFDVDSPNGNYTLSIPSAIHGLTGMVVTVFRKKYGTSGTDQCKIATQGSQTFNGSANDIYLNNDYNYVKLLFTGSTDILIVGGDGYTR